MWPEIRRPGGALLAPHRRYLPDPDRAAPNSGLYPGEPEACRRDPMQLFRVLLQLGLMLGVFHAYRVEGRAFRMLAMIALAALPVHYYLPYRWKKLAFVAVSVGGLYAVFGGVIATAVLALAVPLIGACYLPIAWAARATIVALIGGAMALARAGELVVPVPAEAWPVLAAALMFRMILFLYELKHAERPEPLVDVLAYFFLLPNFCFLLFPVVDYRALRRGYFSRPIHAIQQSGLEMMARGTVHLLAYRLVYNKILIKPEDVHDVASLVGYVACNYLIYMQVSGQFHMACGMLQLFGFALPETHHNYLLATGFTDYWRRINIYWKDFMVRVVFNPVAFRLKRRPQWQSLSAATAVVFVATWALHAYQSFWLRGTWGFSVPDAIFWGILGTLVLVNVQLDARRPRARPTRDGLASPGRLALRAIKTAGTFTTIALLWSLWSSPSLESWLAMLRNAFAA